MPHNTSKSTSASGSVDHSSNASRFGARCSWPPALEPEGELDQQHAAKGDLLEAEPEPAT